MLYITRGVCLTGGKVMTTEIYYRYDSSQDKIDWTLKGDAPPEWEEYEASEDAHTVAITDRELHELFTIGVPIQEVLNRNDENGEPRVTKDFRDLYFT